MGVADHLNQEECNMARIRPPFSKIHRRYGVALLKPQDKVLKKKNYPPGMHGFQRKRSKKSTYALRLAEKQKLKIIYGLNERQLKNLLEKAQRQVGNTGIALLQMCESRLDNVVYRMGFAPTRPAARQLVVHGHILVNGKKVNIPSYMLKPNSVVEVHPGSRNIPLIAESIISVFRNYAWIEIDRNNFRGVYLRHPEREEIPENINEQMVIEFYSK